MKKNKILFILHLPPPIHGASMVGKYIQESSLINTSFTCYYINLALAKELKDIGEKSLRKIGSYVKLLKDIIDIVRKEKPDLCYVTPNAKGGAFYKDFIVVMLLKIMHKKVIIHYHNKGVTTRQDNCFDNFLYKRFFKNLKVILLAENLYNDIQKYVKKKNVYICHNGIPASTPSIVSPIKSTFHILFLSNMMEEKGVWDLLEACRILKEEKFDFHCDLVGKWSDITHNDFKSKVSLYKLEEVVTAHGAKYGKEKKEFMQLADIFVFPTYYHNECFPLVLLEAMEYGIPCISTNEGGISDIIDNNKTGYIVEKKNPRILAKKIAHLLEHPDLCKNMRNNTRKKFMEKFQLIVFEHKLNEILTKECHL